jgi:hypothetical protein
MFSASYFSYIGCLILFYVIILADVTIKIIRLTMTLVIGTKLHVEQNTDDDLSMSRYFGDNI